MLHCRGGGIEKLTRICGQNKSYSSNIIVGYTWCPLWMGIIYTLGPLRERWKMAKFYHQKLVIKKIHIFWNFATKFFWQTTNTSEIRNPAGQVHSLPITPLFDLRKLQTRPSVRYMHIVSNIFKACVCQNLSSLFCVLWSWYTYKQQVLYAQSVLEAPLS